MILKMLQEGKITVEEADALLDVLNEPDKEEPAGFSAEDSKEEPEQRANSSGSGPKVIVKTVGGADSDESDSGGSDSKSGFNFDFDFDLSGLKETLRSAMGAVRETVKGVSDTVKDAFEDGDFSFDVFSDIGRRMGKVRREREESLSADAGDANTFRIANSWGDVTVNGSDENTIEVSAEIRCWGATEEEVEERLSGISLSLEESDGWALVMSEAAKKKTRIDFEVTVPRRFSVTASTASGDVRMEELEGSQSVSTHSGDVELSRLGSDASNTQNISTKSGEVVVAELTGQISVASLAGEVSINGFAGFLKVTASSGDIQISDGRGSVQAKSLSGDVQIELDEVGDEPIAVTALSGDVHMELPEGVGYDFNAKSASGDVNIDFELEDAKVTEKHVNGTANGGGLAVEISTLSGDVNVDPK